MRPASIGEVYDGGTNAAPIPPVCKSLGMNAPVAIDQLGASHWLKGELARVRFMTRGAVRYGYDSAPPPNNWNK